MVAEDVDILEALARSILELDTEEVTEIRGRTAAELNGNGRSVVGFEASVSDEERDVLKTGPYQCP